MKMIKRILFGLALVGLATVAEGQAVTASMAARRFVKVTTLPATCTAGQVAYQISDSKFYFCASTDTWSEATVGAGGGDLSADGTGWPVTANVGFSNNVTITDSVSSTPLTVTSVALDTANAVTVTGGAGRGLLVGRPLAGASASQLFELNTPLGDTGDFAIFTKNGSEVFSVDTDGGITSTGNSVFTDGMVLLPSAAAPDAADCNDAAEYGRIIYDTNATSGQRLYVCESGGWVLQGDGAGGGGGDLSADGTGWPVTAAVAVNNTLTVAPSASDTPVAVLGYSADPSYLYVGAGSPENVVTAPIGSSFWRTDGGASTVLYVKESGAGNTGWVAYGAAGGSGATTALDNLASVAINTSLVSDTNATDDLGSSTIAWDEIFASNLKSAVGTALALTGTAPAATTIQGNAGTPVTITASVGVADTDTAGAVAGGSVTITGGAAARNTSGDANGGDINLVGGAGIGTGVEGSVKIPSGTVAYPGLSFSADHDGTGTGFYRTGANQIGLAINGVLQMSYVTTTLSLRGTSILSAYLYPIANRTSDAAEAATGYAAVVTNAGAGALVTRTLPSAAAGGNYCFYVADTDGLKIQAASGDDIRIAATVSAAAGYIRSSTIGDSVCLVAIDADHWVAIGAPTGTWTFDTP